MIGRVGWMPGWTEGRVRIRMDARTYDSRTSWLIVDSVNNRFDDGVNDGELWMKISHLSVSPSVRSSAYP